MGAFEYTALDTQAGDRARASSRAIPRGTCAQLLREQQLLPVTVEEVAAQESRRQGSSRSALRPGSRPRISR